MWPASMDKHRRGFDLNIAAFQPIEDPAQFFAFLTLLQGLSVLAFGHNNQLISPLYPVHTHLGY